MALKQQLIVFYLDWVNNYLTYEAMAEHYGMTVSQISDLLQIGKSLNEE